MQLLGLPPEIRTRIWKYTVFTSGHIEIRQHTARCMVPSSTRSGKTLHVRDYQRYNKSALAIAFVCKQTYLETSKLYYSLNTFHHHSLPYSFSKQLLPECRHRGIFSWAKLRHIHLNPNGRLEQFVAAIGPVNAASIANLSVEYRGYPLRLQLNDPHQSFQPTHLEVDHRWYPAPSKLVDYVEARKGTGLQLTLAKGMRGGADGCDRELKLASWRKFVAKANEYLAMTHGEATSFHTLCLTDHLLF